MTAFPTGSHFAAPTAALIALTGCFDLSVPPPPLDSQLRTCSGSNVMAVAASKAPPQSLTVEDLASITCRMDQKLDATATMATTAAMACAHAVNAYHPPLPRKVSALRVETTGQAACTQTQTSCGWALYIQQDDSLNSSVEMVGSAGCSAAPDAARGVLFACCSQASPAGSGAAGVGGGGGGAGGGGPGAGLPGQPTVPNAPGGNTANTPK